MIPLNRSILSLAFAAALWSSPAKGAVTLTTLYSFGESDGKFPAGGLVLDAAGNLYGTTHNGGEKLAGTVYEIAAGTHTYTTLHSFRFRDSELSGYPYGNLIIDSTGNLYGTAQGDTMSTHGMVFKIAPGTHTFSTIYSFQLTEGTSPRASVVSDAAGNLYGTTSNGGQGTGANGTVFKLAAESDALTVLHSFGTTDGSNPWASLFLDPSGNIYGTTYNGGENNKGTVFEIAAGTNIFTTLYSFNGADGANPQASLISDAAGNLYGTTSSGGESDYGIVFKIAAGTHAYTMLHSFGGSDGAHPRGGLITDAAGNLYGTTSGELQDNKGTIFTIAAGTNTLSTLYSFSGTDGVSPSFMNLIADANGNLYGTTTYGGASNFGTVFQLSGTGFVVPELGGLSLIALGGIALAGGAFMRRRGVNVPSKPQV